MLDNLVFYYDPQKFKEVSERLNSLDHCLKVILEVSQSKDSMWKQYFGVQITHPLQVFVSNFLSFGEHALIRVFSGQIHWFNFVNMDLEKIEKEEKTEIEFMLEILKDVEIRRWHFELTLGVSHSQTIYEKIIVPLQNKGWKIMHLQPDPAKIVQRDKYLLWHLVHPSRKLYIKGYVANDEIKYPRCFKNMTKMELVLPIMDFNGQTVQRILQLSQEIRRKIIDQEILRETRQIVWAKSIQEPQLLVWFSNSSVLDFIRFTQKHVQEDITPFPYIYITQEETLQLLEQTLQKLEKED